MTSGLRARPRDMGHAGVIRIAVDGAMDVAGDVDP